ncbi:RusA family crossover junction endodeoxyribonuclease [Patescibacteria group bacterium]|nr:RusA family crossover junction endodeoxyribonuclease [Patescibacteria group bacterium]
MKFVILGEPFAKQGREHTVINGRVRSYTKSSVVRKQDSVRSQIIQQLPEGFKPFSGAVEVISVTYVFGVLKRFSKKLLQHIENGGIVYKVTKPDLTDNLNKGLFDAMNEIVYLDDKQIVNVKRLRKLYGFQPRIEIAIRDISDSCIFT